ASSSGFPACTVCLGRSKHDVRACQSPRLWDNSRESYSCRLPGRNLVRRSDSAPLCFDWQRNENCRSRTHDASHVCSGCGSSKHGARSCPHAQ
ncbi:hypothetical protein BDZ97DRAFT_1641117, partial [Flammula alnicola]